MCGSAISEDVGGRGLGVHGGALGPRRHAGRTRVGSAVFSAPTVGLGRQVLVGTDEVVRGGSGLQVLRQFLKNRPLAPDLQTRLPAINGAWKGRGEVNTAARKNYEQLENQQPVIESIIAVGDSIAVLMNETGMLRSTRPSLQCSRRSVVHIRGWQDQQNRSGPSPTFGKRNSGAAPLAVKINRDGGSPK
jgi:hypothetical protein